MYYTKEVIIGRLNLWMEAEAAVATGQSYKIGTRELRRADLREIREQISFWEGKLAQHENRSGARRTFRAVPRDL